MSKNIAKMQVAATHKALLKKLRLSKAASRGHKQGPRKASESIAE